MQARSSSSAVTSSSRKQLRFQVSPKVIGSDRNSSGILIKMKSLIVDHVVRIPINSASYYLTKQSRLGLLPDPASQYHGRALSHESFKFKKSKNKSVIGRINKLGQKVDDLAQGIKEHVRLGTKVTETVKGKLSLGAKILQVGGMEKVFKQIFIVREGEKLLKAFHCYIWTTTGPIAGLLFISTDKVAFCSDRSIKLTSSTGDLLRVHYKVLIPLRKINEANERINVQKPSRKYIQLVTSDNFEFWFMGFLNHKKTLRYLQQTISQAQ